jgi:beta-glucosidase
MRIRYLFISAIIACSSLHIYAQKPLYTIANAPIEDRVNDLVGRMTIDEKIGQLLCPLGWEMYSKTNKGVIPSELYKEKMSTMPIGSFWAVLRADPWTQKTLENGLNPELSAKALNALQKYAVEKTRLGIPILFAEECPHGHMAIGTTVFPTSLSQASTWNRDLMHKTGETIALEARLQGAGIGYGPVLDIAREPRWSRMEETFGEDPVLTSELGVEFMKGMQGEKQDDGKHLFSTLKHFAAYGIPEGGHNGQQANVGMRQLFSEYLPPFKKAVKEGAGTIMTSYNTIDGVPCTANRYLLTDVLRDKWGFKGFVYSDLVSINGIAGYRVAANLKEAAALALKAGVDMDLGEDAYGKNLKQALQEELISQQDIDRAVKNILRIKFRMGLFENPYVSPEQAKKIVRSKEHKEIARQVAREGIVLLKNNNILPLSKEIKSIAVIGPNADMMYNQLGDYTAPQDRKEIVTPIDGIRAAVSANTKVNYVKGCAIRDTTQSDIASAVNVANESDVVILFVGGSSARDFKTKYISTGAATVSQEGNQIISDMECGEGYDRNSLDLLGDQEKLINAIAATGKPMVIVYIAGRPLNMNLANEKAKALLTAWYPGEQGGNAIADVIFGDYNPSGRLPVSVPRNVGQLPVYYSQSKQRDYVEGPGSPLFHFGYGLSYTTFAYSDLKIQAGNNEDNMEIISCTVTNAGDRDGEDVVQLYLQDMVSSVATPDIMLKDFEKISLRKGESKRVTFILGKEQLSLYNSKLEEVVEPGEFKVMIGSASNDIKLTGQFTIK